MNDEKAIHIRLKRLREKRGLSQKAAAEALSIHHSTLSKYESGKRSVHPDHFPRFANLYGVTTAEIIDGTDLQESPEMLVSVPLKRPFKGPLNVFTLGLYIAIFALMHATLFIDSVRLSAYAFLIAIATLLYHGYHFFIHHPSQRTSVTLSKTRTVYYELSEKTMPLRRMKFEVIGAYVLGLMSLMVPFATLFTFADESLAEGDVIILGLLFMANLGMIVYILFAIIVNRAIKARFENAQLNMQFNAIKFIVMKCLSVLTFLMLMVMTSMHIHETDPSLAFSVAMVVSLHFYLLFTYGAAHSVIKLYGKMIFATG